MSVFCLDTWQAVQFPRVCRWVCVLAPLGTRGPVAVSSAMAAVSPPSRPASLAEASAPWPECRARSVPPASRAPSPGLSAVKCFVPATPSIRLRVPLGFFCLRCRFYVLSSFGFLTILFPPCPEWPPPGASDVPSCPRGCSASQGPWFPRPAGKALPPPVRLPAPVVCSLPGLLSLCLLSTTLRLYPGHWAPRHSLLPLLLKGGHPSCRRGRCGGRPVTRGRV